jgi:hypothetical protein
MISHKTAGALNKSDLCAHALFIAAQFAGPAVGGGHKSTGHDAPALQVEAFISGELSKKVGRSVS